MQSRKLVLKRDVLTEIDAAGLGSVVAGYRTATCAETLYSCYTFVSCHVVDCVTDWVERVTTAIG